MDHCIEAFNKISKSDHRLIGPGDLSNWLNNALGEESPKVD